MTESPQRSIFKGDNGAGLANMHLRGLSQMHECKPGTIFSFPCRKFTIIRYRE